jgi:hypothetical protein
MKKEKKKKFTVAFFLKLKKKGDFRNYLNKSFDSFKQAQAAIEATMKDDQALNILKKGDENSKEYEVSYEFKDARGFTSQMKIIMTSKEVEIEVEEECKI